MSEHPGGEVSRVTHPRGPQDHVLLEIIALALRRGRQRCGLSQREVAARAGISTGAIGRIETGHPVSVSTIQAALQAVELDLGVLDRRGRLWGVDDALGMDTDDLRDYAGRRLPAHLTPSDAPFPEPWWHMLRRLAQADARRDTRWPARDTRPTYSRPLARRPPVPGPAPGRPDEAPEP